MTYMYRDAKRMRRRPVHVPKPQLPDPEPSPTPPPVPEPPSPRPAPAPRPAPKKTPRPLPPPVWGGRLGLELAFFEVDDWERRNRNQPPESRNP